MNLEQLRSMKPQILSIAHEHGVGNVRVFGSVARGEADETSDVDLLVSWERPTGWKFFDLEPTLEEVIGCKVDVVTEGGIHPRMRNRIFSEAIPL